MDRSTIIRTHTHTHIHICLYMHHHTSVGNWNRSEIFGIVKGEREKSIDEHLHTCYCLS